MLYCALFLGCYGDREFSISCYFAGVSEVINENASFYAYLIDFYYIWHARLGHVNPTYVMKLQQLGLINMHDKQSKKCEICVESKLTKKSCPSVQHETELLSLIHSDVVDLKQTS